MKYKYGADFDTFLKNLEELYYKTLPILDFDGGNVVFIENHAKVSQNTVKLLLKDQKQNYGIKAAEEEIIATSAIESIDFSRDSVRNILKGMAPKDENETRIMGLKKGLEFIADTDNKISEENLYKLYKLYHRLYLLYKFCSPIKRTVVQLQLSLTHSGKRVLSVLSF